VSAEAICQLITAFAALAAFFGTGIVCLTRGDEFLYAVLKAGGALVAIVVALRFLASVLEQGWSESPRRESGVEKREATGR